MLTAIGISLAFPTLETIGYILIASLNTWIANYKNKNRLVFGMALSYIQIVWAFFVMYVKYTKVKKQEFKTEPEMHHQKMFYIAFGLYVVPGSVTTDHAAHKYSFEISHWQSCIPDFVFLMVFLIYLYSQYKAYNRREKSIEKRITILLVKNFELHVKEDDEETAAGVGTGPKQRAAVAELDRAQALTDYNEVMKKECKRMDRSFLSAKSFNSQNKPVFALMLFCQLISSLSFNALIDIPTFAVLVIIKGFFPFRKSFPIVFGYLTFFASYYVKYLSIIKIVYVCISQLPMFKWFLVRYAKDPAVEKVTLLFGLNFNLDKGAVAFERKLEYYAFVVASLALSIIWQQMKFAQAREFCLS